MNYRYITNKNHSYWSYVHQLSELWGTTSVAIIHQFHQDADPEAAVEHEASGRQVSGHLQDGLAPRFLVGKRAEKLGDL